MNTVNVLESVRSDLYSFDSVGEKNYRLVFEMSSFLCLIVFCLISEMDKIQAIVQSLKIQIYFFLVY